MIPRSGTPRNTTSSPSDPNPPTTSYPFPVLLAATPANLSCPVLPFRCRTERPFPPTTRITTRGLRDRVRCLSGEGGGMVRAARRC